MLANNLKLTDHFQFKEHVSQLEERARSGDADAQCDFGTACHLGINVKKDDRQAVKWWRRAAKQNCQQAYYNLGMYDIHEKREPNYLRGAYYLIECSKMDVPGSELNLKAIKEVFALCDTLINNPASCNELLEIAGLLGIGEERHYPYHPDKPRSIYLPPENKK